MQMPKLVRLKDSDSISIQYGCYECNKEFITSIDNFSKSYVCSRCRARVNTLPVFCHYEGCYGRYAKCTGVIKRITGEERDNEEKKSFDSTLDISIGARPTGDFHDDIGDIRSTMMAYKCTNCEVMYSSASGISRGFDSGTVRCQRYLCDSCGRFPERQELLEADSGADNTKLNLFVEK